MLSFYYFISLLIWFKVEEYNKIQDKSKLCVNAELIKRAHALPSSPMNHSCKKPTQYHSQSFSPLFSTSICKICSWSWCSAAKKKLLTILMSQRQHINDRKVAGAIYTLKDCHMCNLNPQIGAFPRCVGIYLTNDIWNCRRKKHFRTHNKNPATTKQQPCERKPHPAIFHKHHNNAPGTLSTMTELLTHPDCLKKHQQLKLEKAKVILLKKCHHH